MPKKIIKFVILILFLVCIIDIVLYFYLREFELKKFNKYIEICNENTDISNINISVYNFPEDKFTQIIELNDIHTILNLLNDSTIKRKYVRNDIIGEVACRLIIENVSNNKSISISIFKDSIGIDGKRYTITQNNTVELNRIFDIIKEIVLKYDEHALYC